MHEIFNRNVTLKHLKQLSLHSTVFTLSVCTFLGNWTHDVGIARVIGVVLLFEL